MRLSDLQKYILKECLERKGHAITKKVIESFYANKKIPKKSKINDITRSVDRLIRKDMLVGIGRKTSHKWIIQEVGLTSLGRKTAKNLFGKQQILPLRIGRKS